MQIKFESYFFQERAWRFEFKSFKDNTIQKINALLDMKNLAAYGQFTLSTFKSTQSSHIQQCSEGVNKMSNVLDTINEQYEELKAGRSNLYEGMTLKSGMKEKDDFMQNSLSELHDMQERCKEAITTLEAKVEEVKTLNKGLKPAKRAHIMNKNKKTNKIKAKARKQKRLTTRVNNILMNLGKSDNKQRIDEISDHFLSTLHKRYDIRPLQQLLADKFFIGRAAQKVQQFISKTKRKSNEESDSGSDSDSDD